MRRVPVRRAGGSLSHSGQQGLADAVARAQAGTALRRVRVASVRRGLPRAADRGDPGAVGAAEVRQPAAPQDRLAAHIDRKPRRNRRNTPQNKRFRRHDRSVLTPKGSTLATKTAAPRTELGYVNPYAGWATSYGIPYDQFEQVSELIWPNSVWTYTRMVREDARIASVLRAVGLPVRRTTWRIRPNGARSEVVEHVAACMGLGIEGQDDNTLRCAPGPFPVGSAPAPGAEVAAVRSRLLRAVLRLRIRPVLAADGASPAVLDRLLERRPRRRTDLHPAVPGRHLRRSGMVVLGPTAMGDPIPADRLVVYSHDMDRGCGLATACCDPRTSTGCSGRADAHRGRRDPPSRHRRPVAEGQRVRFRGLRPDGRVAQDRVELQRRRVGRSGADVRRRGGIMSPAGSPLDPRRAIEYHDHQMATVALAHFLNLDGKGGSYALASVQADTFVQSVQTVADEIRDIAQAHIVEDLVDVNWGPDEPAPLLICDEIGSRQDATAAALQMLVNAGLLTPDGRLEAFLRSATGLRAPTPTPRANRRPLTRWRSQNRNPP